MPVYTAKAMKILDKPRRGHIGIVRMDDDGARLIPVDRKQKEMRIPLGDLADASDGDLVEVEVRLSGRLMIPRAKVTAVIGNPKSEGAVSLIAIHNLEIPFRFPAAVIREVGRGQAAHPQGPRGLARYSRSSPSIPSTPRTMTTPSMPSPTPTRTIPAATSSMSPSPMSPPMSAPAPRSTAKPICAAIRSISPTASCPCCPSASPTTSARSRKAKTAPRWPSAWSSTQTGHKKCHSFHRVLLRSAAKLSYQQAQAAIDGKPDDKTGPMLEPILKPLWAAYAAMAKARDQRGPLDLDLPERKIILDDKGMVNDIRMPERLDAHRLIEEMMIAANVAAAETLEAAQRRPCSIASTTCPAAKS